MSLRASVTVAESIAQRLRLDVVQRHSLFAAGLGPQERRSFFEDQRLTSLRKMRSFVEEAERHTIPLLANGENVDPAKIDPFIEIVCTREQRLAFAYCRLLSLYPYTTTVGRRLGFLVRDRGNPGFPIIGVGCLASPVRNIAARDRWIGWNGGKGLRIKRKRLNAIVDLATCVAVPPYNSLAAAKLVALAAISDELQTAFRRKYPRGPATVLLTTTSIFGRWSSVYNGLRFNGMPLYQCVGETCGYGHVHIPDDLFERLRQFLLSQGPGISRDLAVTHSFRLKIIGRALRHLGLNERVYLRHNLAKGVFATPLAANWREYLLGRERVLQHLGLKLPELMDYWRNRFMMRRIANAAVMREFRSSSFPRLTALIPFADAPSL